MLRKWTLELSSVAVVTVVLSLGGHARADEFPVPKVDFSADMSTHASGVGGPSAPGAAPHSMDMAGKMYQSGGNTRQEMNMGTMQTVMINRRDKKVMWSLMPMTKTYMEFPYDESKGAGGVESFWKSHDAKLDKIGKEEVNGIDTTHSKVTIASATPDGHAFNGEVWLSKDNIPMRMKAMPSAGGEVVMELKNVKMGKQDASLFELPAGYTKTQMPDLSALTGAAGGAPGAPGAPGAAGKPSMTPEQMKALREQMQKQLEQMQKNMPKQPPAAPAPAAPAPAAP